MLAYLSWHSPEESASKESYEQALIGFHRSLAHRPPSGFAGSATFSVPPDQYDGAPPYAYEDWYLIDSWSAIGVLEETAVARGHASRHDAVATMAATLAGAVYRLADGHARPSQARLAVWVTPGRGSPSVTVGDLLADGMDPDAAGLWRRSLALGPAPEYCLLADEPPAGVAPSRLPAGWQARTSSRTLLWAGEGV